MSMKVKVGVVLFVPGLISLALGFFIGQTAAYIYPAGLIGGSIYLYFTKKKEGTCL